MIIRNNEGKEHEYHTCLARIDGTFRGIPFSYIGAEGTQDYIWWRGSEDTPYCYWIGGNYSCDCNRHRFLPPELQALRTADECGDEINITRVVPLEGATL